MCNDADENLLPIVVTILEKKKKNKFIEFV